MLTIFIQIQVSWAAVFLGIWRGFSLDPEHPSPGDVTYQRAGCHTAVIRIQYYSIYSLLSGYEFSTN